MPLPRRRNELYWCVWIIYNVLTCVIFQLLLIHYLLLIMHAADERNGGSSYCAQVCCDSLKEEPCYDYDDVGNVKQYCAAVRKNHIVSIFIA